MTKAHQASVTDLAELGLCGLMATSWIGALTYLSQLTAGLWIWQAPLVVPFVLLTFLAGFYYTKGREASFFLVKKLSAADFSLQVWLAGLTLPAILHGLVDQVVSIGTADPASIFSFSVFLNSILLNGYLVVGHRHWLGTERVGNPNGRIARRPRFPI